MQDHDLRFIYYATVFAPAASLVFGVSGLSLALSGETGLSVAVLLLMAYALAVLLHVSDELRRLQTS